MRVGAQRRYIPLWRVVRLKWRCEWYRFLDYVLATDEHDACCPICGATDGQACDPGLHA